MKRLIHGKRRVTAIALALGLGILSLAAVALADNTVADGDGVVPVTNQNMSFGSVNCGVATDKSAPIAIQRNGAAGSTNVFANGSTVKVSVVSVTGAGLTATITDDTIVLPSTWGSLANNSISSDTATSKVTINSSTPGAGSGTVMYRATGQNTSGDTITRDDSMTVSWNTGTCTPADTTPPEISHTLNPASPNGENGWYKSNVSLTWTVTENESPASLVKDGCVNQNITGDQAATTYACSAESDGGSAGPVNVTIKRDATKPVVSVTGPQAGETYNFGTVPAAGCETTDATSGVQTNATASTSGGPIGSVTTTCSGAKDNAGNTNQASVTYTVVDPTPPEIDYALDPPAPDGSNGWYKSDVSLTWTVTENESTASLVKSGCNDQSITADQQETTYSCSATSDGGSADPVAVKIKRDAHAPALDCAPGPSGWQASNVVLACTAVDEGPSGLANAPEASFQLSTNVLVGSETSNAQTGSKTVTDSAGNPGTIGPFSFMVDRKGPTVSCDSPAPSFLLNQSPANVTGTAADGGSGPASQSLSKPADTSSVGGGKTVTLTGSDAVGNQGSAACSYGVGYKFDGFYAPVDNNHVLNGVKAGQAIPLKWRLLDATNNPVTGLSSVKVTVEGLNCALGTTTDAVEEYAAGASGLQNLGNGYYQFNWKSPSTYAKSCKTLNLDLGEGGPRTALFQFTK
jgi:hypothetical protein